MYTKGKWQISHNQYDIECKYGKNEEDVFGICAIYAYENAENDLRLISAAPELAEFAKEMVLRYPNSPWIYKQGLKALKKAGIKI